MEQHATTRQSPYMDTHEAAAYLHYSNEKAFRMAVRRLGIPVIKLGRRVFTTAKMLDEFMLTRERKPRASTRTRGKGRKP